MGKIATKKKIVKSNFEIIITGATGFLGRNLLKSLIKINPKISILCLIYEKDSPLEISGRKILKELGVKTKMVDLVSGTGLENLPDSPKLVIHLAAETDTSKKDNRVNDIGTENLYKAFGNLNKNTHFIHIGTMVSVVGRPNCAIPIDENTKDFPTNEYTRTKIRGEEFIVKKCKKDKFRLTVIRPNTIYGKGIRKDSLFDMVRDMVDSNSLITRINWPGRSALIHVDDVVETIIRFTKDNRKPGVPEKYLAYSENLSISEISKIIHSAKYKKFRVISLPKRFWTTIKGVRDMIPKFETIFPYPIYNFIWRFGIIIDDVAWCESDKLFRKFPNFKPKKFADSVEDVLI